MFRRKKGDRLPVVKALNHLFHGIAIEPGDRACDAVRALKGVRFLSEEAPHLPLDGCNCAQNCRCVYRHFADRRTDSRREADLGLPPRPVPDDCRSGFGRRVTDG
jgi:hypothetical protein